MEVGRTGADGLLAPNHVGLGPKNVLEPVRAHLRATVGKRVWDQRGRSKCVTGNPALFMEVGPDGACGQLVPNPVDLEHKLDHEAARNRRHNMAGTCVQER